jgi:hypothetical protein
MPDEDDLHDLEDLELKFVPVSIQQLARAVTQVESCEKCKSEAEIPFDWILRAFAYSFSLRNGRNWSTPCPASGTMAPRARSLVDTMLGLHGN